jgi:hypothetical protein
MMEDYDLNEEVDWRKIFFIDFSPKKDIFNTDNEMKAIMQIHFCPFCGIPKFSMIRRR